MFDELVKKVNAIDTNEIKGEILSITVLTSSAALNAVDNNPASTQRPVDVPLWSYFSRDVRTILGPQ